MAGEALSPPDKSSGLPAKTVKIVQIFEAKTHLSRLVAELEAGSEKEIVIARHGHPIAKLVGLDEMPPSRRIGVAKGLFYIPDNIDEENEAIAASFHGLPQP